MLKEYKVKQILNNRLKKFDDDISQLPHFVKMEMSAEEISQYCCDYLSKEIETIFPAKSFIVAIIYATLIQKYFNEDFYDVLNSKDLFCGTDKYFIHYDDAVETYHLILNSINKNLLNSIEQSEVIQVKKTVSYFFKEFF